MLVAKLSGAVGSTAGAPGMVAVDIGAGSTRDNGRLRGRQPRRSACRPVCIIVISCVYVTGPRRVNYVVGGGTPRV